MEQTAEKTGIPVRLAAQPKLRFPKRKTLPVLPVAVVQLAPVKLTPVKVDRIPLEEETDQDLMRLTQNDDQAAFAIIFKRYSASVLSYLYRMLGSVEDVESIAQEVFLRAYRFRATYQYPHRLSTWLFTITRNLAINQARRRKRNPVKSVTELNLDGIDISGDPCRVASGATNDAQKKEEIARMLKALDELPTDQKEVIVLGVFQDLSYAEMESITGAKAVTLRSRMFHGLKKLARMLKDEN